MSEITRGRTDQLGDLVAVLKLRAVDLDEGAWTAKKDFGRSLYNARLAGASRSQKQKITDRAVRHSHSRQINLIHVDDSAHGGSGLLRLSDCKDPRIAIQSCLRRNAASPDRAQLFLNFRELLGYL